MNAALDHEISTQALVLIEAPSGYGKTVLLTTWLATQSLPVAWLTATVHDAHSAQLLSGVLTALVRIYPGNDVLAGIVRQHHDGELTTVDAVLRLIEVILDVLPQTVVIIDDAHLSSAAAFAEVILPIVQFGQGRLRFVIAGTRDMSSWCARPLAHGDASRVQPSSLAFTLEEVTQLQQQSGIHPVAADQLWQDTQGWPVAVQLALRGGSHYGVVPTTQQHIVSQYIETSVLSGLRTDLQEFVIAAATCNRLSAELARHLSGRDDAAELLEECHRIGLFLDRFQQDSAETVYRWHSTFARHCREIQAYRAADRAIELQKSAAEWLAPRYPAEAVSHALEAGEPEFAVRIIEDNWLHMITGGKADVLAAACARIPAPWNHTPALLWIRASCLAVAGDATGAEVLANQARAALHTHTDSHERTRVTAAFADLFLLHDHALLQAAAESAYELLSSDATTVGQYLHGRFLVGWTELRLRRNPSRAIKLLSGVATGAREAGHTVLAGRALANLAFALAFGGRLNGAAAALEELPSASSLGEWEYYDGGIEVMSAILIAYWRDEFELVLQLARELSAHGGHTGSYAALGRVFFVLATAGLRRPNLYAEAHDMLLGIGKTEMHGVPWPSYRFIGIAHLAIARGDNQGATAALQQIADWTSIPTTSVMAAELYRRLGHRERAIDILRGITGPEMVSYIYASMQFTIAAIAWSSNDHAVAHQALERSLRAAVPEGIVTPYVNLDDVGRDLLTHHSAWGTKYEVFIAARLASGTLNDSREDVISAPLSAREREIFSYLGTTMTAEEIAAQLHVSVNTVRSHQRSIYRKLGVSTRREAIRIHL